MTNFRQLPIEISYLSVGDESFSQILNPLLACTKTYRRSVGFFSSSALSCMSDGVLQLARNGGKIFLATSPRLSAEDILAIQGGYLAREVLQERFLSEAEKTLKLISDENARILYLLIKEGILDIKIVIKKGGIYHDKLALLEDFDGNIVACVGSNNETGPALGGNNYEKIRVYKSWTDVEGRIVDETAEFESIWSANNPSLAVYDFMDAFEQTLLERVNNLGPYSKENNKYSMRQYQLDAKDNWIANGHKGFFVMATGTGKTVTALNAIKEFISENRIFTIIAVPYKHLANQWYEDVKEFFPQARIHIVHGEIKDAETKIYASYIQSLSDGIPVIVITTIKSFFIDRYSRIYEKVTNEKLLIVDEAHNFINQLSEELDFSYKYKLGLSATPVFGQDASKTEKLISWFGGKVIDLPIEKALGKYLVDYNYYPIFVNATEDDEAKFAKATTLMMSAIDQERGVIVDEEKFTLGYRGRLRAISMAEEKTTRISEIFDRINETDHTIIYCSDGRMFGKGKDAEEIRHLEYVLQLLNDNSLSRKRYVKASKFTATEDVDTRMKLISLFNSGSLDYLVAIKCLDEGINIPSIKSALILSSNDNYREFVQRRGRILRLYTDRNGIEKKVASIYDVIVLPSYAGRAMAEIELRRFYEYGRLALNKTQLMKELDKYLIQYGFTLEDIKFKNEYINGGDLDE